MTKKNKHDNIILDLEQRLGDKKYVVSVESNVEYSRGECDVFTQQGQNRLVYYEVKSNYNKKSLKHAKNQLQRWTAYAYKQYKGMDYYGILYTPTKIKILAKNGVLR